MAATTAQAKRGKIGPITMKCPAWFADLPSIMVGWWPYYLAFSPRYRSFIIDVMAPPSPQRVRISLDGIYFFLLSFPLLGFSMWSLLLFVTVKYNQRMRTTVLMIIDIVLWIEQNTRRWWTPSQTNRKGRFISFHPLSLSSTVVFFNLRCACKNHRNSADMMKNDNQQLTFYVVDISLSFSPSGIFVL